MLPALKSAFHTKSLMTAYTAAGFFHKDIFVLFL